MLANLWLRNCIHDPDEYVEWKSLLRPHFVEHAALLELKDKGPVFRLPPLVDGRDVERAQELLEAIFAKTAWYHAAEAADPSLSGQPKELELAKLRFFTLLRETMVGPPAYESHWRDVLSGLFEDNRFAAVLQGTLGFDLSAALRCIVAIESLVTRAVIERFRQADREREKM